MSIILKNMDCFEAIPGLYHAHFDLIPGAKGLQLRLSSLQFKQSCDIWSIDEAIVNG